MAEPKHLNTTELDPQKIKENLIEYFKREDSPYKDWDFEGSGLDLLVTLLANNTHMNAILASVAFNESFIDSAQLRKNVISRAKLLGYIPRSKTAATAQIELTFTARSNLSSAEKTENLVLPRGTEFTAETEDATLNFITLEDVAATYQNNGTYVFSVANGNPITIYQGVLKKQNFTFDSTVSRPKHVINDRNIDTTTLTVTVKENEIAESGNTFVEFSDIAETTGLSNVFFLQENAQGFYEIEFGDGILGAQLKNLNRIETEFISTSGSEGNGITKFFYASGTLNRTDGTSPIINLVSQSGGGAEKESISSVRFNAPNSLITQNRAVTAKDYQNLIVENFGAVDAINVWGGEDEVLFDPDNFYLYAGKVYICIKPTYGNVLTVSDKASIQALLDTKKVFTIRSFFVDPEFTRIGMNVKFTYQENKTNESLAALTQRVKNVVEFYEEEALTSFDGVFRTSNLLTDIDESSEAIISSSIQISLNKDTTIGTVAPSEDVVLYYGTELKNTGNISTDPYVTTNTFEDVNSPTGIVYIRDVVDPSSPPLATRPLKIYNRVVDGPDTDTGLTVGVLNPSTGKIAIYGSAGSPSYTNFVTTENDTLLTFTAAPTNSDIYPDRNNILDIDPSIISVVGTRDNS